jgi:Mn-dependent DtxR family transcriptional regulator
MMRRIEKAVLQSICAATKISKHAHVPEHAFIKKFPGSEREARKALKKLISQGYAQMHPTRGEMTYELTDAGWEICRELMKRV